MGKVRLRELHDKPKAAWREVEPGAQRSDCEAWAGAGTGSGPRFRPPAWGGCGGPSDTGAVAAGKGGSERALLFEAGPEPGMQGSGLEAESQQR